MKARAILGLLIICSIAPLASGQTRPSPAASASAGALSPLDATTRTEVAERLADLLATEYAHPEKGAKMAEAIRSKLHAGGYDAIHTPSDFATALQSDARAIVDDRHLMIGFSGGGGGAGPRRTVRTRSGPPSPDELAQMRRENAAIPEARILDGNIGYMPVNGMLPARAANDAIAAAFAFLHNTDALIIDLRANPGGSGYAEVYLSYLSEGPPYVTGSVHWRKDNRVQEMKTTDVGAASYGATKPVVILTSRTTFSAAEGLAYAAQALKRATLVGETTGGGANPSAGGGMAPLGHGFVANVPTGYVVNAVTGTNWESVGVRPDVPVPANQALAKAWSLAAERLKATASDPRAAAALDGLAKANLDGEPTLRADTLVGYYAPADAGNGITISQRDGHLYQQRVLFVNGTRLSEDVQLVPTGGDRYRPLGSPYGSSSLTFFLHDQTPAVLQAGRFGTSVLFKQSPAPAKPPATRPTAEHP